MSCPEPLERIFRQVEEESERRAQEAELSSPTSATPLDRYVQEQSSKSGNSAGETASKEAKQHRRASVSISRLGQYTPTASGPPSPSATKHVSHSPFYQSQIAAANASSSSVASCGTYFESSAAPSTNDLNPDNGNNRRSFYDAYSEDTSQVFQVYQIAPQPTMLSRLMPRRLSRARSSSVTGMIPPSNYQLELGGVGIGIGVGVEVKEEVEEIDLVDEKEVKVNVEGPDGEPPSPVAARHSRRTSVSVGLPTTAPTLKTKSSRSGLNVFSRAGGRSRSGSVAFSVASAATNTNVSTTSSNASSKPDSPGPLTPDMATITEPKTGFLAKVVDKFKRRSSRIDIRSEPPSPTSPRPPSPLSTVAATGPAAA